MYCIFLVFWVVIIETLVKINKNLLLELLDACKNTHPNEFFAYLGNEDDTLNHYYVVPYIYNSHDSVSFRDDLVPTMLNVAGSIHSHPSFNPYPSKADLDTFRRRGKVHIIVTYPYQMDSIYAYDSNGEALSLQLV